MSLRSNRSLTEINDICYIQIPAVDIPHSADFYAKVFGWQIRQRSDGHTAFDDTTGEVSGEWVLGRPASSEPGLLIYIMVDSVAATIDSSLPKALNSCNRLVRTHPR